MVRGVNYWNKLQAHLDVLRVIDYTPMLFIFGKGRKRITAHQSHVFFLNLAFLSF